MNSSIAKLSVGAVMCAGIGGPGTYYIVDYLKINTIQDQLKKDGLKIIDDTNSIEWDKKIKEGESTDLKSFVKKHKEIAETINKEDLQSVCKSLLTKNTSEINYEQFKKYCSEEEK